MNLTSRIAKLERTLAGQRCICDDNRDLAWPHHHPDKHCLRCGGERVIYQLPHHPRDSEPQLRTVLPLLDKAYDGTEHASFDRLTNHELQQLRAALQAFERHAPTEPILRRKTAG